MHGVLAEYAVQVQIGLSLEEQDPLRFWHFAVPRVKQAFRLFTDPDPIDELVLRGPNKGTKTETKAAVTIRCLQKMPDLDGVPLPQWKGRVEAAQLCLDYQQQLLSVKPAYLRLIGKWPHHTRYVGEALSSIHIKPRGCCSDDEADWSVINFLTEKNPDTGVGMRADVIDFDEPAVMSILRELRKAAHAGRRCIMMHGLTPTIRRQWAPVRDDYGETPRRSIRRIDRERAEVRWSLDEVADWVLTPEEKSKQLRKYTGDPLHRPEASAREHGDYTITEGSCPFDVKVLKEMLELCIDPEVVDWRITEEGDGEDSKVKVSRTVPVEVWQHPKHGKSYYICIDPSSGVDDSQHDPYEIEISELGSGDLVARVGGYLSGRTVGILAAGLARQYNGALIDPEVNDRWGVNVVEGVYAAHYGTFAREARELSPGQFSNEIGFHNTALTRPIIIGSIQAWLEAWKAGIRYAKCSSRFVIETLLDCVLDQDGKVVGAPGVHDEALIVRGQTLRTAVTRSGRIIPEIFRMPLTREQKLGRLIQGLDEDDDDDLAAGILPIPIERPR